MERIRLAAIVLALATQVLAAPQLISLGKNGEVGVNFGGYHASAGLGGLLDGGASGGLHAEAGTPHGQEARAGLGGSVDSKPKGVIYGVEEETGGGAGAKGIAYAEAHSGKHAASASLSGETVATENNRRLAGGIGAGVNVNAGLNAVGSVIGAGAAGLSGVMGALGGAGGSVAVGGGGASSGGSYHSPKTVYVEKHIATNYVTPEPVVHVVESHYVPPPPPIQVQKHVVKQYDVQAPSVVRVEKVPVYTEVHHVDYQPIHHHHVHANKHANAWAGVQVGVGAGAAGGGGFGTYRRKSHQEPLPPQEVQVAYKKVHPALVEKRIDVAYDNEYAKPAQAGGEYTTKVKLSHRNPTFFADIFNIPIQALSSVSRLVGNAVAGTNISVEKSAFVHADKDTGETSKSLSTDTAVQLNTPSATSVLDDIFAIPINTLGAVNKFLENNVPARRKVIVQTQAEVADDEPTQIRLKGKARRRAARRPIIVHESASHPEEHETPAL